MAEKKEQVPGSLTDCCSSPAQLVSELSEDIYIYTSIFFQPTFI